jgi:hypothetical protein
LDPTKIFNQDPHFLKAVDYFNTQVLHSPNVPDEMTWEKAVNLYELFRGDDENPHYIMSEERQNRLAAGGEPLISQLLTKINAILPQGTDTEKIITEAAEIYEILGSDDIQRPQILYGRPGFDKIKGSQETNLTEPSSGHHRLAWFLMNFFLIRNGYQPFYFEDVNQYNRLPLNYYWKKFRDKPISLRRLQSFLRQTLKAHGARLSEFEVNVTSEIQANVFIDSPQLSGGINHIYVTVLGEELDIQWQSTGREENIGLAMKGWITRRLTQFGNEAEPGWTAKDLKNYLVSPEGEKGSVSTAVPNQSKPNKDLFAPVVEDIIRDLGARDQTIEQLVIKVETQGYDKHEMDFVLKN